VVTSNFVSLQFVAAERCGKALIPGSETQVLMSGITALAICFIKDVRIE